VAMPVFKMEFNGLSVQFSPFDDRLAVGAAQNFGIIGNGKQYVLQVTSHYSPSLTYLLGDTTLLKDHFIID